MATIGASPVELTVATDMVIVYQSMVNSNFAMLLLHIYCHCFLYNSFVFHCIHAQQYLSVYAILTAAVHGSEKKKR